MMKKRTILIVDRTLIGHALSLNRLIAHELISLGHQVILAAPDVKRHAAYLGQGAPVEGANLVLFEPEQPPTRHRSRLIPKSMQETLDALRRWYAVRRTIRAIESLHSIVIDHVVFSWLDDKLARFLSPFVIDRAFPWNWSGIYFHPRHLQREPQYRVRRASLRDVDVVLRAKRCKAVAIHERTLLPVLNEHRFRGKVQFIPEVADLSPPDHSYPVAKAIRDRARGRTVVGIIGCERHKGLLHALALVGRLPSEKFYFALVGVLPLDEYSTAERARLHDFFLMEHENVLTAFHAIPEGAAYNAVVCAIDIHLLLYEDFDSSSNRLTKAVHFQRPVVCSDCFCIAQDVRDFQLGDVVSALETEAIANAVCRQADRSGRGNLPKHLWDRYSAIHARESLSGTISKML